MQAEAGKDVPHASPCLLKHARLTKQPQGRRRWVLKRPLLPQRLRCQERVGCRAWPLRAPPGRRKGRGDPRGPGAAAGARASCRGPSRGCGVSTRCEAGAARSADAATGPDTCAARPSTAFLDSATLSRAPSQACQSSWLLARSPVSQTVPTSARGPWARLGTTAAPRHIGQHRRAQRRRQEAQGMQEELG